MLPEGAGWQAALHLGVERRDEESILALRRHSGPLRVQKALWPEGPGLVHLVMVHPPGGIAGGDQLSIDIDIGRDAAALVTTPGAAKWYKANGRPAGQQVTLRLAAGATLEWLPQENIVFDGARIAMALRLECASAARACGWEISVLGRRASQETFKEGQLAQRIDLLRDGKLLWSERACLNGGDALLASALGWDGAHVSGLFWLLGSEVGDAELEHCRAVAQGEGEPVRLGITRYAHELVLARVLGASPERVRSVLTSVWAALRPGLNGRSGVSPRIWAT